MNFNLKKHNTSGLSYVDDGQILPTKIKDNKIISSNIIFSKPYKIQIRASKMLFGKRKQIKKVLIFEASTTLLDAIKKSSKIYEKLMNNLSNENFVKQDFSKDMLYKNVYKLYIEYKVAQYESREDKNEYNRKDTEQFHNKWLKPILDKPIGMIDEEDIQKLVLKIKRAGLAERTSRKVYQYVNPVFKFFNMKASKYDISISSPAKQQDLPPLNNERGLNLSIEEIKEVFKSLKYYPTSPPKEIYMFLMHGRRLNEVLSLSWSDIDFENDIYTIKALNNKARVDMTYHLSKRLIKSLKDIGIKDEGLIFPMIHNKHMKYSEGTIRNHWKQPIVLHQLRNCIGMYLQNELGYGIDIVEAILGHKQNKKVTNRYAKINHTRIGKIVDELLDDIFDENIVINKEENKRLAQLQVIFPTKSIEELKIMLEE